MYVLMKNDWENYVVRLISQEVQEIPYEILIALLNTVGVVENDFWVPNRLKIYQMCAIDLFISNKEYFLEEFLVAFDKITEITI